ncbi:MAG: hypothetical protein ACYC2R_13190 [Burkholderiales bacterium]
MKTTQKLVWMLGISAVLATLAYPAQADDRGRDRGPDRHWGGDIRHFDRHDIHVWRGGSWRHGHHDGRFGWWWVVAGMWYFYPQPVYPYPDPYQPPVVVVPQQPSATPPDAAPAAPVWYYCPSAQGYYPYVSVCPGGWKTVPATPPER